MDGNTPVIEDEMTVEQLAKALEEKGISTLRYTSAPREKALIL